MKRKLYLLAIMSATTILLCGCNEKKEPNVIPTETESQKEEQETEKVEQETEKQETEKVEQETEASEKVESEPQQEAATYFNQELKNYKSVSFKVNYIKKKDQGYEIIADVYESMLIKREEAENLSVGSKLDFGDDSFIVEEITSDTNNNNKYLSLKKLANSDYDYMIEIDDTFDYADDNGNVYYSIKHMSGLTQSYKVAEDRLIFVNDDTQVALVDRCDGYEEAAYYAHTVSKPILDPMEPDLEAYIINMSDFYSINEDLKITNEFNVEMDDKGNITYIEEIYTA